ncbi:hypothetical protein [Neisseria chenwenguii]|uniref:hypothetical protein n=1 Tax=Neisseria chenwenguii TaxID=1853278 RepID=UPI000F4E32B8|nr:hypothetical protein [Neisseria chenwenguii]
MNLNLFFIKTCENPTAANIVYSFWECLKTGSIKNGSIIRSGDTEKLLEVKHDKINDEICTKNIIGFSNWLIESGFEIDYGSPLYPESSEQNLKGTVKIHEF